jgi:hypothetical protein
LLLELIGDPHLPPRRPLDRLLDRAIDAILLDRIPLADLSQRRLVKAEKLPRLTPITLRA